MKKQFVNYKTALKLKELGFDEECFSIYNTDDNSLITPIIHSGKFGEFAQHDTIYYDCFVKTIIGVKAPLYQQVVDWFREEHNIIITIEYLYTDKNNIDWFTDGLIYDEAIEFDDGINYKDYYKALNKGIETAIEVLEKRNKI
jgi:hypothetical protein